MENANSARFSAPKNEQSKLSAVLDIAIIELPHIACLGDFAPLSAAGGVSVRYVSSTEQIKCPDLLILPGSESSIEDLIWLHECGLAETIKTLAAAGTPIIGICGGYQLLSEKVSDDAGTQGGGSTDGLGLLPVVTVFSPNERRTACTGSVASAEGCFASLTGAQFSGFETHFGRTTLAPEAKSFARLSDGSSDGCVSGNIIGTYQHGIFDDDEFRKCLLFALCERRGLPRSSISVLPYVSDRQQDKAAGCGLIQLYTGDGKGKTSAALGSALRFAGHGKRVIIVQLCKGSATGELEALKALPNITVLRNSRDYGFWSGMSDAQKIACRAENDANLRKAADAVSNGLCDLLILDEVTFAYESEAADRQLIADLVTSKSAALELILTGRNAPAFMRSCADYISEIKCIRHPYEKGISAREGAEF